LAYHRYKLHNEKYVGTEFKLSNTFLNYRAAVNYNLSKNSIIQFSYARVSREPRLKNYYDAAESSAGETPQFELKQDGSYDFNKPYVKPETMNDIEFGGYYQNENFELSVNLFFMLFKDEIVKKGNLDRFGQPITGNIESTIHRGIELSCTYKPIEDLQIHTNAAISNNLIKRGKYFIDSRNFLDLKDNRIAGFPDFLANLIISYKPENFYFRLSSKYVGKFFLIILIIK
jgi:iron complex outermembrane recepter protein